MRDWSRDGACGATWLWHNGGGQRISASIQRSNVNVNIRRNFSAPPSGNQSQHLQLGPYCFFTVNTVIVLLSEIHIFRYWTNAVYPQILGVGRNPRKDLLFFHMCQFWKLEFHLFAPFEPDLSRIKGFKSDLGWVIRFASKFGMLCRTRRIHDLQENPLSTNSI